MHAQYPKHHAAKPNAKSTPNTKHNPNRCRYIVLEVMRANKDAVRLYERKGYVAQPSPNCVEVVNVCLFQDGMTLLLCYYYVFVNDDHLNTNPDSEV